MLKIQMEIRKAGGEYHERVRREMYAPVVPRIGETVFIIDIEARVKDVWYWFGDDWRADVMLVCELVEANCWQYLEELGFHA